MEMVLMQAMHVYFHWNGNAWAQRGGMTWMEKQQVMSLVGSVALSSDGHILAVGTYLKTFAVGGFFNDGNGVNAGHARVFYWNGSAWAQRGDDLDGEAAGDDFGYSVALSSDGTDFSCGGNILAVGGMYNDGNGAE
uniref:Uncharacterized protein n=1 Tax=Ditylum brightwellii TaxID=49249 RepID=A0A7S4S0K0_9STRA